MAQKRDLHPITVYLPPAVLEYYQDKAAGVFESTSTLVRRIVLSDYERELSGRSPKKHS